jgi:hypothetical protein
MRKVILAIFCQLIGLLAHTQFSELSLLYPNTVTAFSRTSMGLGDMDLDGDLDVVSYSNGLLTVGINNNGQFGEIQSWNIAVNTTHSYKHIRCVDIDSDGDTDVLTSRFWIENDNGNFAQVHYYVNANTELYSLKLGHLDAGTYVDIYSDYNEVNGNFVGGAVPTSLVILNPGNSSLDAVLSLPLEETASVGRNCLGDVNGDGTDEVIIRFGFPQTQKVYSLVGNSLQYLWQFSAQTEGYSFADMNGDGLDDLVYAGVNYNSNTYFAVGLNSGNQSFNFVYADQPGGGGATYSVESFGELPVLDYDGDGDLDFIGIDFNNGKKWIRNNGGVAFEFMGDVVHNGYNQSATSLLLGNLDSDPEVEMVEGFNGFAVLQQGEGGYMQSDQTIFGNLSGNDVKTIISCDINQDGERDVICSNRWGIFYHPVIAGVPGPCELLVTGFEPDFIDAVDANLDGWVDLFVEDGFGIYVFPGTANGRFGKRVFLQTTSPGNGFAHVLDVNGDGAMELFHAAFTTGHTVYYSTINTDWTLGASTTFLPPGNSYGLLKSGGLQRGDVNADGLEDLVLTTANAIFVYLRNSLGELQQQSLATVSGDRFALVDKALQDVNNDGYLDISYCIFRGGLSRSEFGYYSFNGSTFDQYTTLSQIQSGISSRPDFYSCFMDVNDDAFLDFLAVTNNMLELYQQNSNGSFDFVTSLALTGSGEQMTQVFLEDVDLNGTYDLVVRKTTNPLSNEAFTFISSNLSASPFRFNAIVFLDNNQNGVYDLGEAPLQNQVVHINGTSYFTPSNGTVIAGYDGGEVNYALNLNSNLWLSSTALEGQVVLDVNMPVANVYFGVYPNGIVFSSDVSPVALSSMCLFESQHYLFISNDGNSSVSGNVLYTVDSAYMDLVPLDNGQQISEYVFQWTFENLAPGSTIIRRLEMTNPFELDTLSVLSNVFQLSLFDENNEQVFQDNGIFEQSISCAYDPNYKEEHNGWSTVGYIENGDELRYTIHFQNTGNAPAQTVRLTDQLSEYIDRSTIQPIGASHSYSTQLDENGLLTFTFENINLPDSASDLMGSMGFVTFKVRPIDLLPYNTVIENTAQIYFDFNEPIITNTTVNTILDCENHSIEIADLLCEGGVVSLSSSRSEFVDYTWTIDGQEIVVGQTIELTNLSAGEHHVAIEVSNPVCSLQDEVNFNVIPLLTWASVSEDLHSCGEPVELSATTNASSNITYFFNENIVSTEQIYTATEAGLYTAIATNECGSIEQTWELQFHDPVVEVYLDFETPTIISATPGFVSYDWSVNGQSVVTSFNYPEGLDFAEVAFEYQLVVTDEYGCTAEASGFITSTSEVALGFSLYPNPTSDEVMLTDAPLGAVYKLLDMSGKLIQTSNVVSTRQKIDLTQLPAGIYQIQVIHDRQIGNQKVVKTN